MTLDERAKTVTDAVGTATTGAELRALITEAMAVAVVVAVEEEREAIMEFAITERDGALKLRDERSRGYAAGLDWLIAHLCQRCNKSATET